MATIKLASLFIRTLSKPLANTIKTQAKNHPAFKNICISIAQKYHSVDVRLKRRLLSPSLSSNTNTSMSVTPDTTVRPLNEARAVELGANFIGELTIFSVAVITILAEIYRSSRHTKNQKDTLQETLQSLREDMNALTEWNRTTLNELKNHQDTFQQQIQSLESRILLLETFLEKMHVEYDQNTLKKKHPS